MSPLPRELYFPTDSLIPLLSFRSRSSCRPCLQPSDLCRPIARFSPESLQEVQESWQLILAAAICRHLTQGLQVHNMPRKLYEVSAHWLAFRESALLSSFLREDARETDGRDFRWHLFLPKQEYVLRQVSDKMHQIQTGLICL